MSQSSADEDWPKDGDRLLIESNWFFDAHTVQDPAERFYRLPMGYKRAGDILVDQAKTNVVDRPNIIYAALFCYRQSIELYLKRFIDDFGDGRQDPASGRHDLHELLESFMRIATERGMGDAVGMPAAKKLVSEMHAADQRSDGFRFATDKKGTPFSFGDKGIDLDNLCEVMGKLENFLECAYMAMSHQDENRCL